MSDPAPDLAVRKAVQRVSDMDELLKREEFGVFMEHHQERAGKLADQILNDDSLSHEEREALRQRLKELKTVLESPESIKAGSNRIISSASAQGAY